MRYLVNQSWFIALMSITLIEGLLSVVNHAEVIAHKTGKPCGALVIAISATIVDGFINCFYDAL